MAIKEPLFFNISHKIAERFEPRIARSFLAGLKTSRQNIDQDFLVSALAGKNLSVIEAAVASGHLGAQLLNEFDTIFLQTAAGSGAATSNLVSQFGDVGVTFNARNPNVVLAAREQTGLLIANVADDVKDVVRIITAMGSFQGLTIEQQARIMRGTTGLRSSQAMAPLNFAEALRNGDISGATSRRLSATDKAKIRRRIKAGTVTEEFIEQMTAKYTASLINRRALDIARTESLRASHIGQRQSWAQAIVDKALPPTIKRFWIVTNDSKLSEDHAEIPGMNPEGRGLDEPYDTPEGPVDGPPIRTNCRCGEGLIIPELNPDSTPSIV